MKEPMKVDYRSVADHLTNRDLNNRKPYRNKELKRKARQMARVDPKSGKWFSTAPVMKHPVQPHLNQRSDA